MATVSGKSARAGIRLALAGVATAAIVGGGMAVATPAHALPVGCRTTAQNFAGGEAYSWCDRGSGSHRIQVKCVHSIAGSYWTWGPWRGTSQISLVQCTSSYTPRFPSVQIQGD